MKLAAAASILGLALGAWGRDSAAAPAVHQTYFKSSLNKLLYFKNPATLLGLDRESGLVYRSGNHGAQWDVVAGVPGGKASRMYAHPFEATVAYVLSDGTEHWLTRDEGVTWQAFSTPLAPTTSGERALGFHAQRTRWILYTGERCVEETVGWWPFPRLVCHDEAFYVRDGFEQAVRDHSDGDRTGQAVTALMAPDRAVAKCMWAHHTTEFDSMAEEAIFCLEVVPRGTDSALARRSIAEDLAGMLDGLAKPTTVRLVTSEDFFHTQRVVRFGDGNDGSGGDHAGGGVVAVSVVKDFVLAAISHAHSDEMDLFVSMDGHAWAESRLPLPPGTREDAYTILESTKYAVFVDVMSSGSSVAGSLYRSNSNGTYYTQSLEHTHRSRDGVVDVERVHGVTGVVIANQVANWEQAQRGDVLGRHELHLRSRISFNDGARWRYLRAPETDADGKKYGCTDSAWQSGECALHVHSVTSTRTPGRVFGAPAAPGIVLAVGSVGSQLRAWADCDTFLSRDGGLTWTAVHRGAHHVQIADSGAALVLASSEETSEVRFSADGGRTWQTAKLEAAMQVTSLVTDDDGLSPVVLAAGSVRGGSHAHEQAVVALDFARVWARQCAVDASDPQPGADMERFVLSAHEDNDCVMGHRTEYVRRRADAPCAARLDRVLEAQQTDCACTDHDFECDYNYARDGSRCTLVGAEVVPHGQCRSPGDRYLGSSGFRLIPGNTCTRSDRDPDRPVERACPKDQPAGGGGADEKLGDITHHTLRVQGDPRLMAFPNSTAYLVLTSQQQLFRTDSEGAQWTEVDLAASTRDSKIGKPVYLAEHPYDTHRAFAYTDRDALAFTGDRGATWTRVRALPARANGLHVRPLLDFSAADPDHLLFVGGTECPGCHTEVWVSRDNGAQWRQLATHATKCLFARTREFTALPADAVVCTGLARTRGEQDEARADDRAVVRVYTQPFRDSSHHEIAPDAGCRVGEFHIYAQLMLFATTCTGELGGDETLQVHVTDDGRTLHAARLPPGARVAPDAFTLLPAQAGGVLLDADGGHGWGQLFASSSNGSHLHRVLTHTNRGALGAVDVERVDGLPGMLLANRVDNADALGAGVHKRLRTAASWDGGRSWHALPPPATESCADCALHLFGRATGGAPPGAGAAPGVLIGVGTVGTHLGRYPQARTYMSRDGGVTWAQVRAAPALHALADHGALALLAADATPTSTLAYSADGGRSWADYRFSDAPVIVDSIGAGAAGGGQRVLVRARPFSAAGGASVDETLLVTVDFSRLHARTCTLDTRDHARGDFELWTPRAGASHRDAPRCVLGAEAAFWRRKPLAACAVGDAFAPARTRTRACECALADYECDEGFWRNDYGECVLDGPDARAPADCRDGSTYMGRSGYRRVPQSQCEGGSDLAAPVERVCGRAGGVQAHVVRPDAPIADLQFFRDAPHAVARTERGAVLVSLDEGGRWAPLDAAAGAPAEYAAVLLHPVFAERAFFVPRHGAVGLVSDDAARTTRLLRLPAAPAPALQPALRFHPEYPEWLLFMAQRGGSSSAQAEAFVSRDGGASWDPLVPHVGAAGCAFLRSERSKRFARTAVVCARHPDSGGGVAVSENWFRSEHVLVPNATDFALVGRFLLISQDADQGRALAMHVSADGRSAAQAQFPGGQHAMDPAYTVLEPEPGFDYRDADGRTHTAPGGGLALHVTTSAHPGAEWGALYTSNSNGTYFRRALEHVNRDDAGLVDFERVRALEGVALANVVANPERALAGGEPKRLRSMVTVDGGARWRYLRATGATPCHVTAPQRGDCALHLHGYTEVSDPENIYSAAGAVGLAMGVGNVGAHLGRLGQADTYLSADGGVTWAMTRKGPMWHEFGDHGALIVVADRIHPVSVVEYSLDRGRSWLTLPLPHDAHSTRVDALTTTPDSSSRRFVLHGRANGRAVLVGLDFTGAQPRVCKLSAASADSDFERFAPHLADDANPDRCLLGRKAEYFRRKPAQACYVGGEFEPVRQLTHICECTEYDYECNHNFVRQPGHNGAPGKCVLIEGMQAPRTNCSETHRDYFVIESAYRRIPQSVCRNGLVLDRPTEVWCPGKARTVAIFWALVLPVAFLALAYLGYKRWRDQYPYLRLEDLGEAVRPALQNLHLPRRGSSAARQLEPLFTGAVATARAVGGAAKESCLWALDKAAPYLPHAIQRWSYEHPPRWGGQRSLDGRSRRGIRRSDGQSRFTYRPLNTSEAAARVFGSYDDGEQALEFADDVDDYDEVEAGFNHFLDEDDPEHSGEADATVVDRQVLFANDELSDDEGSR